MGPPGGPPYLRLPAIAFSAVFTRSAPIVFFHFAYSGRVAHLHDWLFRKLSDGGISAG